MKAIGVSKIIDMVGVRRGGNATEILAASMDALGIAEDGIVLQGTQEKKVYALEKIEARLPLIRDTFHSIKATRDAERQMLKAEKESKKKSHAGPGRPPWAAMQDDIKAIREDVAFLRAMWERK